MWRIGDGNSSTSGCEMMGRGAFCYPLKGEQSSLGVFGRCTPLDLGLRCRWTLLPGSGKRREGSEKVGFQGSEKERWSEQDMFQQQKFF